LVWGQPVSGGRIEAAIARHPRERTRMAVSQSMLAKPAVTHYTRLALLCVDTADSSEYVPSYGSTQPYNAGLRTDINTPSQTEINRQGALLAGYMTRVALTEVNMQWAIPNVNEYNNTLTIALWDLSGAATYPGINGKLCGYRRIVLPLAFYTIFELRAALQTSLNAKISGFTDASGSATLSWAVVVDAINQGAAYFTITLTATSATKNMAFQIVPGTINRSVVGGDISGSFLSAEKDDLTYMMGLTPCITNSPYTSYDSITGWYATMQYTPYIDIQSNYLTKNQNVADNDSSFKSGRNRLARIYLSNENIEPRVITAADNYDNAIGVRPFAFRREFKFPKQIMWNNTENVDLIDITITDRLGNKLYSIDTSTVISVSEGGVVSAINGNNTSFQFTVQATEV
jgi:hypothetical protein